MDGLKILPLAITMMVGPQIVSAVILVTAERAVRLSLAFLAGVAAATALGVAAALGLATLLGGAVDLGDGSDQGSVGLIVQYALVALLVLAAVRSWLGRRTAEPPGWLRTLMSADARRAFTVGVLVILAMPSDILVMLTVGTHLAQYGAGYVEALPFVGLTVLVAALPLAVRLLLGARAATAAPHARDWLNAHSWLVNIVACAFFVLLILL
ncbi:GAP family protein [Streptomyces sp. B1866]|uniref:GAP family protein n=1 Tax=Streptomyces sp. B1866 TaxID=3075431 RepID=UPI002890B6BD|nr:GAP family protein [Streptomyces sp. B1866]MDT3395210.1 GAP family protein [Streptomyces sp. B1866]